MLEPAARSQVLGERIFDCTDQECFAEISGDRNPIHMDGVAARRTLAGTPVVHGVRATLWALDRLFRTHGGIRRVATIRVRFERMIHEGDRVVAVLAEDNEERLRADLMVDGVRTVRLDLGWCRPPSDDATIRDGPLLQPAHPLAPTFEQMTDAHGLVPFAATPRDRGGCRGSTDGSLQWSSSSIDKRPNGHDKAATYLYRKTRRTGGRAPAHSQS